MYLDKVSAMNKPYREHVIRPIATVSTVEQLVECGRLLPFEKI